MIRLLVLALIASPISSRPGYRSSVMHGSKPILRMGPDETGNVEADQPEEIKEPLWVTNLRTNIQKHISEAGFQNAKPDIKDLIQEASEGVNAGNGQNNSPEVRVPIKEPLRAGYYPKWENDLKSYIKELIRTYGRINLDGYVRPVVNSIERQHHVSIKDIDGNIVLNYTFTGATANYPDLRMFQRDGPEPRYTMAPFDFNE